MHYVILDYAGLLCIMIHRYVYIYMCVHELSMDIYIIYIYIYIFVLQVLHRIACYLLFASVSVIDILCYIYSS